MLILINKYVAIPRVTTTKAWDRAREHFNNGASDYRIIRSGDTISVYKNYDLIDKLFIVWHDNEKICVDGNAIGTIMDILKEVDVVNLIK